MEELLELRKILKILTVSLVCKFSLQEAICFAETTAEEIRQGAYITKVSGCADCHTVNHNQPMAGGFRMDVPKFGIFHTPNITPDRATGIGNWTLEDFQRAMRDGVSPKGEYYYPAFPFRSYTKLKNSDIRKIFAYLMTLEPIYQPNKQHDLLPFFQNRNKLLLWRALYFNYSNRDQLSQTKVGRGEFRPLKSPSPSWSQDVDLKKWNRGAYLVEAVHHCAECHTRRTEIKFNPFGMQLIEPFPVGGLLASDWMAGTYDSVGGDIIPNITPDKQTGLGSWSKSDWVRFLASGINPKIKTPGGEMAHVIQNTSSLTKADREAVAIYMMSLPPISSVLPKRKHE